MTAAKTLLLRILHRILLQSLSLSWGIEGMLQRLSQGMLHRGL